MISPKNSQTYNKFSSSSSSSTKSGKKRKRRTSTTKKNRIYKKSRLRNWSYKKRAKKLAKYRSNSVINVANDKEGLSRSYHKQKVTRSQQRIINKRFKNGYSPMKVYLTDHLQLTSKTEVNKCKWIWRTKNTLGAIVEYFLKFPIESNATGGTLSIGDYYRNSQDQSIYLSSYKYIYDIMNPTNYDMDLIIYDIVYKQDTSDVHCNDAYWENNGTGGSSNVLVDTSAYNKGTNCYENPIALINTGMNSLEYSTNAAIATVADPTQVTFDSLNAKPSDSYPFNIYCKIVKKHRYRLQPGATMTHIFTHKPKCLFNRGYLYKYKIDLNDNTTSLNDLSSDNRAIKDITSGCLFKFSGQILNSGEDAEKARVLNASGKLVIKERVEIQWYAMNSRFTYIFNRENNWDGTVSGGTSKIDNLEVINNDSVKPVKEVNMVLTDNTDTTAPGS